MKKRWKEFWGETEKMALDHLYSKGFILNNDYSWSHKNEDYTPRPKDLDAIDFLKEVWSYKGYNNGF